ncbi:putative bifunctional diguanylate cyclase/phosphodiesterase [Aliikangiella sp. IMCC44653]
MADLPLHELLKKQLQRNYPVKKLSDSLTPLLSTISEAYQDFENDRKLLERSLELVSEELNQKNRELSERLQQLQATYQQLGESMSVLDGIFDATGEAIFAFDIQGNLIRSNQSGHDVLRLAENHNFEYGSSISHLIGRLLKKPDEFSYELRKLKRRPYSNIFGVVELKDGRLYEYHSSPQLNDNALIGRVWCFRNVTQIKENEKKVKYQAFHDALTELPNRLLLTERLNHAITLCDRNEHMLAILFIDLDYFKKVNDTAGHQVGDKLLVEVAKRIKTCLREHDTLSRFGGDEFVVLLENISTHRVAAKTSQRIIEQLKSPFEIDGYFFHISSSIGVSLFPRDDTSPEELIRKADLAMYHAKQNGRCNFEFFASPLERFAHYQLQLENKLREAMHGEALQVYYQPQVDLSNHSVWRMEALARWFPTEGKPIAPTDFIPVAERTGIINELSEKLFEVVCQDIKNWRKAGFENICVSVNLSAKQIDDANLLTSIRRLLLKYQVPGHCIEFELTESILLVDLEKVNKVLKAFRKLDITIAIDDFGTGYSSLKYLQTLPIDIIKIDRSFIIDLMQNESNQLIVNAIISLSHNLNLQVVAEGVEDKCVVDYLTEKHCQFIQGFYFYPPLPSNDIPSVLSSS